MANFFTDNPDLQFQLSHPLMKRIVALKENHFQNKDDYDFSPKDFEDAMDSYTQVLKIVGEISGDVIAPNAESVDHDGPTLKDGRVVYARGTQQNIDAITQAGLMGITLPRKYDGLNFSIVPYIIAGEMVARADAGFVNIWGLQDCAEIINDFGSDDQRQRFLTRVCKGETMAMALTEPDAGSDLQAVMLRAHFDEKKKTWVLNGVKRFITNGDANISLVLARSEEGTQDARGLSMFIYDKQHGGVTVRRLENKLGIKGSPTCELVFKDAQAELCGDRKFGLIKYVMALMNGARLGIAGQSVAISEAAYREALNYANNRVQFGKPIIQFPAVYELLAVMKAKLTAARCLLYETARFVDMYKALAHLGTERELTKEEKLEQKKYQKLADVYTPLAKGITSEYCNQIAYDALQIHGGSGFMKDYPIERIFRDARITTIYEGTTQLQVIAAIKGVITGAFLGQIEEYDNSTIKPETESYRSILVSMTFEFEEAEARVTVHNTPEFVDFHARRLVEMAGNIIMGYLLLNDTQRDHSYWKILEVFLRVARANNAAHAMLLSHSTLNDLGKYKN
ncbi:MAG: acyl-CoA dehydrogenase [Bacteroidetes bacterium RIFCSPLOWO2_12_FULL_31_6]|nr:MAG: acyl-CoA dehydrogenase [Bacteroidetes bacterium RIFCSPLOWO2_12_FULL_31_6]